MSALGNEHAWLTLSIIRSSLVRELTGELTQVSNRLLRAFYTGAGGDIRTGVEVQFADGSHLLIMIGASLCRGDANDLLYTRRCCLVVTIVGAAVAAPRRLQREAGSKQRSGCCWGTNPP